MPLGCRVSAFEIAGSDTTYDWERLPSEEGGCERVTVFPDGVFERIPLGEMRRGIVRELDAWKPDAMAIAGWGTADARACLDWCRKNGAKAIVMSETRAADGRRVWWKEWVKSRIVRKFDAALCGGASHKRYLVQLGMPEERIAYGYNIVDNEFFAVAKALGLQEHRTMGPQEDGAPGGTTRAANLHEWGGDQGGGSFARGGRSFEPRISQINTDSEPQNSRNDAKNGNWSDAQGTCAGASDSDSLPSKLADSPVSESLIRSADGPAGAVVPPRTDNIELTADETRCARALDEGLSTLVTSNSPLATAPEALAGPYFLASNRFVERKNLGLLIRAYVRYVESLPAGKEPWPMVLLGDGELRGKLMLLCEELGAQVFSGDDLENLKRHPSQRKIPAARGCVVFAGFRQIAELPAFYAGAGAFVHPALEEPWGLVINEAMASGLPVLSSRNVGAAEELVVDGETGYLFDSLNTQEIADAMAKVVEMPPEARSKMRRAACEMVERKVPTRAFGEGLAKALRY